MLCSGLRTSDSCSDAEELWAGAAMFFDLQDSSILHSSFKERFAGSQDMKVHTSVKTCQFHLRCDTSKDHDAPRHLQDFLGLGRAQARSGVSVAPVKSLLAWLSLCCLSEALPDGPVCVLLHGAIQDG